MKPASRPLPMKKTILTLWAILYFGAVSAALAQGTAFTYQGRLNDGGNPANGSYDLRFALYDALGTKLVASSRTPLHRSTMVHSR